MLIERYEQEHHAFDATMSVTERIQAIVESAGMTASQLGLLLGSSRALGGKLLRGEREPSKQPIRILSDHFHLNPRYFL